jgi:pentatricopeptide repeat protein
VFKIFEEMETKSGLRPELLSYNQAILGYGRLGQWHNALRVFNTMKEMPGIQPDEVTYNYLIGQCGRRREWQVAAGLFGQMQRRNVTPSVVTYNQLITTYADSGQLQRCLPVLRRMMDLKRCKPNTITFNALLTAFSQDTYDAQASRDAQATLPELVEVWQRLLDTRCRPTCLTYDAFVGACEAASLNSWVAVRPPPAAPRHMMLLHHLNPLERVCVSQLEAA